MRKSHKMSKAIDMCVAPTKFAFSITLYYYIPSTYYAKIDSAHGRICNKGHVR